MESLGSVLAPMKLDSLFGGNPFEKADDDTEKVVHVTLSKLHDFKDHPFGVRDDESMMEMAESVKERGVLVPGLARPRPEGGYEIVAGHRRKHACELAGLETIPLIIRDMDDDTAIIIMVDSNIQREDILPSEKAKAFKMKMEAVKRKAGRPSKENSGNVCRNLESAEIVGNDAGISARQVRNIVRLTELAPDLLEMVDSKEMAVTPAVELSFLKPEEQQVLADLVKLEERTPSLSQAQRLKQMSQQGELSQDTMLSVLTEQKPQQKVQIVLKEDKISRYFPKSYTPKQIEDVIIKLLEGWYKKRQQEQER